jgi:hypothetical protein
LFVRTIVLYIYVKNYPKLYLLYELGEKTLSRLGHANTSSRDVNKNRDVSNSRGMWTKIGMSATAEGCEQK